MIKKSELELAMKTNSVRKPSRKSKEETQTSSETPPAAIQPVPATLPPPAVVPPTPVPAVAAAKPPAATVQPAAVPPPAPPVPWWQFIRDSDEAAIRQRFAKEMNQLLVQDAKLLASYIPLAILSPGDSIDSFESDRIFSALMQLNGNKDKDVLLFLLSPGGSIEPAYQISTLCKAYSKNKFIVAVPRQAKSAATLISIGADEIHMGPMSQLGPIDPQLGGLPALGVVQAVERIASLAQKFPGSSEMFSKYLKLALTVEQIGYCERISESAVQYAIRLLNTKPSLRGREEKIATELVYEYKDHGFVIDLQEAQQHLGANWIKTNTPELQLAEKIYQLFKDVNFFLGFSNKRKLALIGSATNEPLIWKI